MDRDKRQKKNRTTAASLMRELQEYEKQGTQLYLEDHLCRAEEIVRACQLAEDSDYMRDFISDDRDHITEIHFVRISGRKDKKERNDSR